MKKEELIKLASKYAENECSPQEKEAVENFFRDMQNAHRDFSMEFPEEKKQKILANVLKKIQKPERKKRPLFYKAASIAAMLIGLVSITFFSNLILSSSEKLITQTTAKAERKEIHLKDGSIVFLNSNSSITYKDNFQKERNIKLRGEAFFDVKPNPDKPFTVTTGNVETKVLGTSFNIHAYQSNNIGVSVNTGKVKVGREGLNEVTLTKNQQVNFIDGQSPKITIVKAEDFNAWIENMIVLNNTSLGKTAEILENWYDIQIDFEQEDLEELSISGKFKDEELENVLESIAFIKQLEIEYVTQKQILIREKAESSN